MPSASDQRPERAGDAVPDLDRHASLLTPPAVSVEDLWMVFRTSSENTWRNTMTQAVRQRSKSTRTVEALRGVSFDVPVGSVYGVIGRNGAGKSTLFRAVAGILPPTKGRLTVRGRVTPLLSLGLGFNRGLSGRENILLGGLAAGLSVEEILASYHDIVAFAELGPAIDSPMRTYSSGMFARLGFAIAVHLDPEILLIDEALSAGDANFTKKCRIKIRELAKGDCTFMLVSHGLSVVKQLADYCVWLDRGRIMMDGPAKDVIAAYLESQGMLDEEGEEEVTAMEDF